jgi:two-component system CheB/CheR fusion protein
MQPIVMRYGVAIAVTGAAAGAALSVAALQEVYLAPFLGAVMVAAWYGGLGPGLVATALSMVCVDFLFLPPIYALGIGLEDGFRLAIFASVAALISSLNASRRRLEEELRQRDRNKDRFLATLAHELRTPLSTCVYSLEAIRHLTKGKTTAEAATATLGRQLQGMVALVDELADASRVAQGKIKLSVKTVELGEIVTRALETAQSAIEARGHRLGVKLPGSPVWLEGDPDRLNQVFVNLLTNAARYTENGGQIWIEAEQIGGEAIIRVRDTGRGLDPKVLPHVFDFFVQGDANSAEGLGVGLGLVQALVLFHGGTITASSDGPGTGALFTVRLPADARAWGPEQRRDVAQHIH